MFNLQKLKIMDEKIYCHESNDNAIAAAILANKNDGSNMLPLAMMNGGMNGWANNPFAYLMFLALFRNGGFGGWGDGSGAGPATQGIETQAQLNAIRTQLQDNQNADCIKSAVQGNAFALSQLAQTLNVDFNALQKCCCDVQAAIQQVSGQTGLSAERVANAAYMGDCRIIEALKDCCCQTQRQIADFRADIQLQNCQQTNTIMTGINGVNTGVERGFSQMGYETQKQTCDIINNANANTQRIIDTLNNHWSDEKSLQIQDLKFQLSQERQNNLLLTRLGGNGCGCGNSCGCVGGCGQ